MPDVEQLKGGNEAAKHIDLLRAPCLSLHDHPPTIADRPDSAHVRLTLHARESAAQERRFHVDRTSIDHHRMGYDTVRRDLVRSITRVVHS